LVSRTEQTRARAIGEENLDRRLTLPKNTNSAPLRWGCSILWNTTTNISSGTIKISAPATFHGETAEAIVEMAAIDNQAQLDIPRSTVMQKALQALSIVTAVTLVGCHGTDSRPTMCHCPIILAGSAVLQLPCGTIVSPDVRIVSGPCNAKTPMGEQMIELLSSNAGTCRVELTFAGGTKSSVDINYTSGPWMPCGSDPHGCGQSTFAKQPMVQIGEQCADAGADSGASD
jgi:hypothetical protein